MAKTCTFCVAAGVRPPNRVSGRLMCEACERAVVDFQRLFRELGEPQPRSPRVCRNQLDGRRKKSHAGEGWRA